MANLVIWIQLSSTAAQFHRVPPSYRIAADSQDLLLVSACRQHSFRASLEISMPEDYLFTQKANTKKMATPTKAVDAHFRDNPVYDESALGI
jgi:hypothetical protein